MTNSENCTKMEGEIYLLLSDSDNISYRYLYKEIKYLGSVKIAEYVYIYPYKCHQIMSFLGHIYGHLGIKKCSKLNCASP